MRYGILFGAAVMVFAVLPMGASAATLCEASEKPLFSCRTQKAMASLCQNNEAVIYRYGRPGKVELTYPDAGRKAAEAFRYGTLMFSGGGGTYVQFSNQGFDYTVFSAIGKWGKGGTPAEAEGIAVARAGKPVANLPCEEGTTGDMNRTDLEKIGVKEQEVGSFEIPDAFMPK